MTQNQQPSQSQKQGPDEDLPPIGEAIEDAIGTPEETVSGDPAYAPDPEFAAMQCDGDERDAGPAR